MSRDRQGAKSVGQAVNQVNDLRADCQSAQLFRRLAYRISSVVVGGNYYHKLPWQ